MDLRTAPVVQRSTFFGLGPPMVHLGCGPLKPAPNVGFSVFPSTVRGYPVPRGPDAGNPGGSTPTAEVPPPPPTPSGLQPRAPTTDTRTMGLPFGLGNNALGGGSKKPSKPADTEPKPVETQEKADQSPKDEPVVAPDVPVPPPAPRRGGIGSQPWGKQGWGKP